MPEPDCFLHYHISAGMQNFMSGKSDVYVLATAATRGSTMVLFTVPLSRQNTFVGGTCAPLSALVARVSHQQPHHVTNHPSTHDMTTTCHMTGHMSYDT